MTQNVNDASVGQPAQENDETICVSATVFDPGKDDHPAPQPTAASMVSRDDPQVHNQAELETDGAARGAADNVDPPAGQIPSHPFAKIFPLLGEEALRELAGDIAERELIDPIVLYEGKILDGRCRYRACLMAGVKPRFKNYEGDDPLGYVVSRNIQRRHLIKEGQRAIVAARIASLKPGSNQHSEGLPIGRASKFLNVGSRSVARAREVLDHGVAELVQAVEEGKLAVSAAAQISRLPEPQQHEAIKHDRTGLPARTVIASAPALAPGEAEVAASDPADGFDVTGAAKVDTAEAGQAPAASAGETTTASVMESSRATARSQSGDRWLWPGGLVINRLLEEPMLVALPGAHALARGGSKGESPLPLKNLARETFILYGPPGIGLREVTMAACRAAGFTPRAGQEAPRIASTLSLVAVELGISLVPASLRHLYVDGVVYRRLRGSIQPKAPLDLASRRGDSSVVVQHFLNWSGK